MGSSGVIGKGIRIQGDLLGDGDLVIEGEVEGRIQAGRKVELKSSARVEGEIHAPTVVIEEGASFSGTIQMDVGVSGDV